MGLFGKTPQVPACPVCGHRVLLPHCTYRQRTRPCDLLRCVGCKAYGLARDATRWVPAVVR